MFFYVRSAVSHRDLEEIMSESGIQIDHSTLNRRVAKASPFIAAIDRMLRRFGSRIPIEMLRIKDLNNIFEPEHRTIDKRTGPMLGFKSAPSGSATLEGIKVANIIRKGQMTPGLSPFAQFASLAA